MTLPNPPVQGMFINPVPQLSRQPRPGYDTFNGSKRLYYRPDYQWGDLETGHRGVDLAGPTGSPVVASAAGTVRTARYVGPGESSGNYVEILHPDGSGGWFLTRYLHLKTIAVLPGSPVNQGQTIGLLDTTGYASYPHVHFDIRHSPNPASRWWTTHGSTWGTRYDPLAFGILTAPPAPQTLVSVTCDRPLLRLGAQERRVKELQALLNIHMPAEPPLTVDGEFGPKTEARVKAFQADEGLAPDGIVGKATWHAILDY